MTAPKRIRPPQPSRALPQEVKEARRVAREKARIRRLVNFIDNQHGPVTATSLDAAGIQYRDIRLGLEGGAICRISPGLYVLAHA